LIASACFWEQVGQPIKNKTAHAVIAIPKAGYDPNDELMLPPYFCFTYCDIHIGYFCISKAGQKATGL
jgi:hypothetical protein